MMTEAGTDESESETESPRGHWVITPFVRLARVHAFNSAADAMVAVALAGSLFFSIEPDAARSRVLLYLLFTIAPFAIVGPFIGPAIDKAPGGRRAMVIFLMAMRAIAVVLMVPYIESRFLFPIAFANLVLGKSYSVAKASIVPNTVDSDTELVDKNSRLAVLTGLAGFVGAAPAVLAQWLLGSKASLSLAVIAYLMASFMAVQLPRSPRSKGTVEADHVVEARSAGITLSGSAMGMLRGIAGFMTFMIAFGFRGGSDIDLSETGAAVGVGVRTALGFALETGAAPAWQLGIVLACNGVGALSGSFLAPRLRERTTEEVLLVSGLILITVFGIFGTWTGGLRGAGVLAFVVGFGANAAKVAFDAIVQRDGHDADYGASFARFETRFQIAWVVGALIPVLLRIPPRLGYFVIALAAALAALSFLVGFRALRHGLSSNSRLSPWGGRWTPLPGRRARPKSDGGDGLPAESETTQSLNADARPGTHTAPAQSVATESPPAPAAPTQSADSARPPAPVTPRHEESPADLWDDHR